MNIAVGLIENAPTLSVSLRGEFRDASGESYREGAYQFDAPVVLEPVNPFASAFVLDDFKIGIGFHWERSESHTFRGSLRIISTPSGLTAINDIPLETYVESVLASEMSSESPLDLLKAHAVVSRSWLVAQLTTPQEAGTFQSRTEVRPNAWEILAWYGRESHPDFDVCADDHCQRYQGIGSDESGSAIRAARETAGRFLLFDHQVCDARFYKCCGGVTEAYSAAWDDRDVPYLTPVFDGQGPLPDVDDRWIREDSSTAFCNTRDVSLLGRILTGFDQETTHFFRWTVRYSPEDLGVLVEKRSGIDLGTVESIEPLERGRSGRIVKLELTGSRASLRVGKELEIRRLLSSSHLYSSAFVVDQEDGDFVLRGAGWGHGVGLCQIGAGVMAERGFSYQDILAHYYPGSELGKTVPGLVSVV
jgi:stage II sporulation protein D